MPELLFINKSQSSDVLTRSKPTEKSRLLRHVQSRRRRDEAKKKRHAWLDVAFPAHNSSDPFYSTVAGRDVGSHAMVSLTFSKGAKMTFLAEAFAPASVFLGTRTDISMRHDRMIQARLHRCVEDDLLMYATLAYGSSCLAWMYGILDPSRPPEYFIAKAISKARHRIADMYSSSPSSSSPTSSSLTPLGHDRMDKQWLALSIYSLAITENWNHMPVIWAARCPSRYALALRNTYDSKKASRVHLQTLVNFVAENGGWAAFDPYILESAILADKYLSLWEMESPIIPLETWDPGPLRLTPQSGGIFSLSRPGVETGMEMGSNLVHPRVPLCNELKGIVADIVDYIHVAPAAWTQPQSPQDTPELQSWLFLRLQSFYYQLMMPPFDKQRLPALDDCIRIVVLTFLLTTTNYHGATACAAAMAPRIRSALVHARFWDENVFASRGLRFWCLCIGAIAAGDSPDREWFLGQIANMAAASDGCQRSRESIDGYLFLRDIQGAELFAVINKLPSDAALHCMTYFS